MSLLKILQKPLAVLAVASMPFTSLGEWLADITINANTTEGIYSDITAFGAKTNATANYDSSIDSLDPPGTPTGVNIYQELTNSAYFLSRNYVGTNDISLFRGVIEYNGIAPTSTTAVVRGLPDSKLVMLTFSDDMYANRNGEYNLENGKEINLKTNTHSYIITPAPIISGMSVASTANLNLMASFYCDGKISSLDVKGASTINSSFTNSVGQLNLTSVGNYTGTNNIPSNLKFFRLEIPTAAN